MEEKTMKAGRSLSLVVILGGLSLSACASWQPVPIRPTVADHAQIRVTRSDSSQVMLNDPAMYGDSLGGFTTEEACVESVGCYDREVETRLPLSEVLWIEALEVDGRPRRAAALGAALGVVLFLSSLSFSFSAPG
jgi:hypothetical protein